MQDFPIRYFLIEDDVGNAARVIRSLNTRMTEESVYYWINEITHTYGTPVIMLGARSNTYIPMVNIFFDKLIETNVLKR